MLAYAMSSITMPSLLAIALYCQSSLSSPLTLVTLSTTSPQSTPTGSSSPSSSSTTISPLSDAHPISGPLISTVFADPSVINVNGTYYAYATNNAASTVPIAKSLDFEHWTVLQKDALPQIGAWAVRGKNKSVWAPNVIQTPKGHFVMYYTATVAGATPERRCVGSATSTSPEGPFEPDDKVLVCPTVGTVIDPAGFFDNNGSHYLVHKLVTDKTSILLQPMTRDGLATVGPATTLIEATEAESWNTEAPSLVYAGGSYVLFFSTGFWEATSYTVSVATASNITGPYVKRSAPLLATGSVEQDLVAPGGADILFRKDIDNNPNGGQTVHMVFHAAESRSQLGSRHLWTGQVKIDGKGVSI